MAEGSTREQRERELKFDVPDTWALPELTGLVAADGSVQRETVQLQSSYYDTADWDLLHARITLRRRTGDADTGWQLKVPDGDARTEIRLPLGGRGVPEPLRTITLGVRAGAALKPIAMVRTERAVHRLVDAKDTALAELVVDDVTATQYGEAAVIRTWREVEVELVAGDERLLSRTARWLGETGARPSASESKLARALDIGARQPPETRDLGGLIRSYLDAQYQQILSGDLDLRREHNVIHPTRVATRRYRSVLRVFATVLDSERAARLDVELKWFASALGEVRDRQVLRAHLDEILADLPPELVLGPVRTRIDQTLTREQQHGVAELERVMRSRRYLALLRELREWSLRPPITANAPAAQVTTFLDRAERKVRRRLKVARHSADRDVATHRARKAAKRARYTAELSEPTLGRVARKRAKQAKKIQQRLGDRQDRVVAAAFLRRIGAAAGTTPGENGFTFGLLYERELELARRVDRQVR
ncbi:MAG TPA: CYTH and CHAD domain-containing protein [Jatrophihabitans sp.]|jgi:CHAD domain-containing protein|nr:CYTH and CHAD domain-containing protein [Jatrophihabitans sp.]